MMYILLNRYKYFLSSILDKKLSVAVTIETSGGHWPSMIIYGNRLVNMCLNYRYINVSKALRAQSNVM